MELSSGIIDPPVGSSVLPGGSLQGTMTTPTTRKKKTYDPKRRAQMMQILADGEDPDKLRYIHVMHGYDMDEVNDAIDTYNQITGKAPIQRTNEDPATDAWADAVVNKRATMDQAEAAGIDPNLLVERMSSKVAQTDAKKSQNTELAALATQDRITEIDDLKDDWYLDAAVGTNWAGRISGLNWATSGKDEFLGKVQNIMEQATLEKLVDIKGEGATLGALSDKEREMLQNAATPLWKYAIIDQETGKIEGFDISEDEFKNQLDKLKQDSQRRLDVKGGGQKNPLSGMTSSGLKYVIEK